MAAAKAATADTVGVEVGGQADFRDLFALLKPRVMSLVVFTAAVGMLIAPGSLHPFAAIVSILFIALGAGASGALNMWWDADIDAVMRRTRSRPIPSGKVNRDDALTAGLLLSGISVVMLALAANVLAALLLAFTIFYYVVLYTMQLKRMTPQNIVIGGAAGAFPPVIGWAAATGTVGMEAGLMFLLIFVWTPPHFWSLALFVKDDYARAGVPMLTVQSGPATTRYHILGYALALVPTSMLLAFSAIGGPVYAASAAVLNLVLVAQALRLWRRDEQLAHDDRFVVERKFFTFSIGYLFILFLALALDSVLREQLDTILAWPQWI